MFNMFNIFRNKKEVTVQLNETTKLTVTSTTGGVNATIVEMGEVFIRNERAFFSSLNELVNSLGLTDDRIVRKLSKAF